MKQPSGLQKLTKPILREILWRAARATGVLLDGSIDYDVRLMHHAAAARRDIAMGIPGAAERWETIIGRVAREANFEFGLDNHAAAGTKVISGARKGGQRSGITRRARRDQKAKELVRAYVQMRRTSHLSDSALMKRVGARHEVPRSTAIALIKQELKKMSNEGPS